MDINEEGGVYKVLVYWLLNGLIVNKFVQGHLPIKQPAFKSLAMNIKSEENETVFLPCVVEDLGDSAVRWWKEERLLSDSSSPLVAVHPKYTVMRDGMSIGALEPEDAGHYTCELVRPHPWSSLRQTHRVQVLYPAKVFPSPPDGYIEVQLGERVHMGCGATGFPPPVMTWRTQTIAAEIPKDKQMFDFTASDRRMAGIYQCEANNGIGEPVHANIRLRILHKPEITVDKYWIHTAPGIKTSLVCHIVADPEAQVEWLYNGQRLTVAAPRMVHQVRGNDHVLQMKSVSVSDFGKYTCRAWNGLGSSLGFMELSGIANPVVIKKAEKLSPTDFSLIWEVDSYSPIFEYKVHFRKQESQSPWTSFIIPADGFLSGPLHSKSYTFSGLDKFAVYEAKIYSRNRFGWSNSSEVVTFGYLKPKYEEGSESPNEVFRASTSIAPLGSTIPTTLLLLLPPLTLSPYIYDTL